MEYQNLKINRMEKLREVFTEAWMMADNKPTLVTIIERESKRKVMRNRTEHGWGEPTISDSVEYTCVPCSKDAWKNGVGEIADARVIDTYKQPIGMVSIDATANREKLDEVKTMISEFLSRDRVTFTARPESLFDSREDLQRAVFG